MNSDEVLLTEKCGALGQMLQYKKHKDENKIHPFSSHTTLASVGSRLANAFRGVFLPHGYPDSVSGDYAAYQLWDTAQASCSTITGTFATHAVLGGIGVGDADATALAAAITWVLRDGTGMVGRIWFAWWKGNSLDSDCKKWRLFADIMNDSAMFIELLLPYFSDYSLHVLCLTSSMKALVGVAGGATRAAITQHQAIQGNMADVSAKDGSQETCVNLLASFVGIFLLALLTNDLYKWFAFLLCIILHLLANYYAVSSLRMLHLNTPRLLIVLQTYLVHDIIYSHVPVNQKESVILGFGVKAKTLCGFNIKMGASLRRAVVNASLCEITSYTELAIDKKYLIVPCLERETLFVAFEKGEAAEDVIAAYFHAVLLGMALGIYNDIPLASLKTKRKLHQSSAATRIATFMKNYTKNQSGHAQTLPMPMLADFNDFVRTEFEMFFTGLRINGWNMNIHSMQVDQWRAEWKVKKAN